MSTLMDRLAALSVSQLASTAKGDSAAAVLAEWELAKRTGGPLPTRTAVVEDGDYLVVAGPQNVQRVLRSEVEVVTEKARYVRKDDIKRFTLGPLYIPDFMDAHGEWTDADELQKATWEWVRAGDRRIFDQHDRTVVAGEWVEVMTMPQPWTVMMRDAYGNDVGEVTYPANTVFLGVVWNETAWEDVRLGKKRGYSIGGFAERRLAELPPAATREGVEMPTEGEPDADA